MALEPLDWLLSLAQFGIKFGLDNVRAIVAELDHPERQFRSVHVAGTNGKGSVTAMIESALRAAGLRTGRYTSPHLLDLRERVAINGIAVSDADLAGALDTVRNAVERLRLRGVLNAHPTFFEVTTVGAFELFRRHAVDVAVCEVGMGGRLDATNVLSPIVCAITSIGVDHEQYLGPTLPAIAAEKGGIIKPGTPVVVGGLDAASAATIRAIADGRNAPLIWASTGVDVGPSVSQPDQSQQFPLRTPLRDYGLVRLALAGRHQVGNAVVAVRVLEELEALGVVVGRDGVVSGMASVQWPGRLQQLVFPDGRDALLDAAHNAAGAEALAQYLAEEGEGRALVFAAMRDKDATSMLRTLAPVVSRIVMTRASNPRSADPTALAALARMLTSPVPVEVVDRPSHALERAWARGSRVVVAGSIFLLADVMKGLGRS